MSEDQYINIKETVFKKDIELTRDIHHLLTEASIYGITAEVNYRSVYVLKSTKTPNKVEVLLAKMEKNINEAEEKYKEMSETTRAILKDIPDRINKLKEKFSELEQELKI